MSAQPSTQAGPRAELTRELADQWGRLAWDEFLGRFDLPWEGAIVLDFGCGAGYVPMYLAERTEVAEAHGVDLHPVWESLSDGFRPHLIPGVRLHSGDVLKIPALQRLQFDVVVSASTLSRLQPTVLMGVLHWFYDHLKPGGHCLFQVQTYMHPDAAELGDQAPPFAQLLFGAREIAAFLKRTGGDTAARYVNPSCAATYLAQFARAGFVAERVERLSDPDQERLLREHRAKLRWLDPEELKTSSFNVHLRRPAMPDLSILDRRSDDV